MEQAGITEKIDHRTLKAQREEAIARGDKVNAEALSREPEIHVGVRARQMERKGTFQKMKDYLQNRQQRKQEQVDFLPEHEIWQTVAPSKQAGNPAKIPEQQTGFKERVKGYKSNPWRVSMVNYLDFSGSRATFNQKIINKNREMAVVRREELQGRQYRLEAKKLFYMAKNNAHARKRVNALTILIDGVLEALVLVTSLEKQRSQRLFDYNRRSLFKQPTRLFENQRGFGYGRERALF